MCLTTCGSTRAALEQASLRRAAQIAMGAHRRAMRFARPGRMEYEVMAEVLHEFRSHNADISYHPIVGGGANACVMHYRDNDQPLCDGDLLLLDAGCELDYYASDITRTFPVGGRFTPAQRAVYEVVLGGAARRHRQGAPRQPLESSARGRRARRSPRAWSSWACSRASRPQLIKEQAYLPFFNHRTGHWLGLDVHDVGDYKVGGEWRVLEPGMALTVEPGIYIRPVAADPQEFWNIGIRIEDEVLVTAGAPEVLTAALEKTPDAIEALVRRPHERYDIAIVGGGMVGASLARRAGAARARGRADRSHCARFGVATQFR